jgi:Reverse transcriptase (RNA-dependent DNA polymerase)
VPAITHGEKCEALQTVLFPTPEANRANIPLVDMDPHPGDMQHHKVKQGEVRDALFTAAPANAPGISSLTGKAYCLAWGTAKDEIYWVISTAAETGYHPEKWQTAIAVALCKPNKPDYSQPHAYRLIQLLEVIGKVLECIQARRLSYIVLAAGLIPTTQFGGLSGRSTKDAILMAVNDVKAVWNHKLMASTLTFDIVGYFDFIRHDSLLAMKREKRLPLPLVKWMKSFLSNRKAVLSLDGKQDVLWDVATGIPQGSCISPVLAAYFSAPLVKHINVVIGEKLENDAEFADELREAQATNHMTVIYVDDRRITVSSNSLDTNVKFLAIAYTAADKWLKAHGLSIDPIKKDLIHHTRSTKVINAAMPDITLPTHTMGISQRVTQTPMLKWLSVIFD